MKTTNYATLLMSLFILILELVNAISYPLTYGYDYIYRPLVGYPLFTFICFYVLIISRLLKTPEVNKQRSYDFNYAVETQKQCLSLFIPVTDSYQYAQKDYWSFNSKYGKESKFKGDCDDFCLRLVWLLSGSRRKAIFDLLTGKVALVLVSINAKNRHNREFPNDYRNPFHLILRLKVTHSKKQRANFSVRYFDNLQGRNGLSSSSPHQPYTFIKVYTPFEIIEKVLKQRLHYFYTKLKGKIKNV